MSVLTVILLPLLTICFLPVKKFNRILFYILIASLGVTNLLFLLLFVKFQKLSLVWNIVFLVDKYSWFLAIIINLAWMITTVYSFSFIKYAFQKKAYKFHFYLSIVLVMVLATVFAGNLVTLFIFYVLTVPFIYPLIVLRETKEAYKAGKNYLISILLPAFFIFLPAIIITYKELGLFDFGDNLNHNLHSKPLLASLLLVMFIIGMSKNCVIPFNNWLPKTALAPAPVSALLHSIADVKSASIALIKIALYVFGLDFLHQLSSKFTLAGCMTYLCGITALYSAYKAFKVDNLKTRFSYSTVTQLSYIITAILIATPTAILGAILHILTHSIAKINLFFIAGFYNCVYGTTSAKKISSIAPHTKYLAVCVGICGLSIAGFPLFAGYLSKDLMLLEELHAGNYAAAIFLLVGSIINVFYILPIIKAAFWGKADENITKQKVPLAMQISISACVIILILLSIYTYNIIRAFEILPNK